MVAGAQLLAGLVRLGLLRHRDDGHRGIALRHRPLRHGGVPGIAPPGRPHDRGRAGLAEDGARAAADLRPDDGAQVGHFDGRVCLLRGHVQQLRHRAGRRPGGAGGRVRAGLPTGSRDPAARHSDPARSDHQRGADPPGGCLRRRGGRHCRTARRPDGDPDGRQSQARPASAAGDGGGGGGGARSGRHSRPRRPCECGSRRRSGASPRPRPAAGGGRGPARRRLHPVPSMSVAWTIWARCAATTFPPRSRRNDSKSSSR